jgi:outer membrane protein TolC
LAPFHNDADASSAQGHSAPPLDRWWTGFDDPMLVTVVQRALNENLDLDAALARVRQARATASNRIPSTENGSSKGGARLV